MNTKPIYALAAAMLTVTFMAGSGFAQAPVPRSMADVVIIKGPRHAAGIAPSTTPARATGQVVSPGVSRAVISVPAPGLRSPLPRVAPRPLYTTGQHTGNEVKP